MSEPVASDGVSMEDLLLAENERLKDLLSSLWLYTSRHAWTQLTTAQKELFADVVDADHRRQDLEEGTSPELQYTPLERWWRDGERSVPSFLSAFGPSPLPEEYFLLCRETAARLKAAGAEGTDEYVLALSQVMVNFVLHHPALDAARTQPQQ